MMVLRNQVEWALHCAVVLAGLGEGERLSTSTLAEYHGVPKEYLSKALQALAQAGLIEGTLGPTGGYRLAWPARSISFLDVIEAVEGKQGTFECTEIRGNNPCLKKTDRKAAGICQVARVMYRADEAWREQLRKETIEDLLKRVRSEVPAEQLERSARWLRER